MKNQSSMMLEDSEESIFIELEHREFKETMRLQEKSWKHQWLPPCLARQARKVSMERPVAKPMSSNQNLCVSWKPVNPQDCEWKNLYRSIMRTILQERVTIHSNITIWYINFSYASSHEHFLLQKQQWIKSGGNWKRFQRGTQQKSETN